VKERCGSDRSLYWVPLLGLLLSLVDVAVAVHVLQPFSIRSSVLASSRFRFFVETRWSTVARPYGV
jgi:hypothetical protein